jgi:hypothetical protein
MQKKEPGSRRFVNNIKTTMDNWTTETAELEFVYTITIGDPYLPWYDDTRTSYNLSSDLFHRLFGPPDITGFRLKEVDEEVLVEDAWTFEIWSNDYLNARQYTFSVYWPSMQVCGDADGWDVFEGFLAESVLGRKGV